MNLYEIYTNDNEALRIARTAFPQFTGKSVEVEEFKGPMRLDSYWSGGSRDYYVLVNLETYKVAEVPENGSGFIDKTYQMSELPQNLAVVNYHIGIHKSVTIYVNKENMIKMLPLSTDELSWAEKVVLVATRSLKSSYGGIPNYRMHTAKQDTGITEKEYLEAKEKLIKNGYLNAAGALTIKGKNAVPFTKYSALWALKKPQSSDLPAEI